MTGHAPSCGRVLVADDDRDFLEFVSTTLESAGFTIVAVTSGLEALEVTRSAEPDLVVLDVQLPGMSGYEVCRELRDEFGEGLPILFVSGFRTESLDRVAGLLVGADDYLVKPFAPDELIGRVRALVRRRLRRSLEWQHLGTDTTRGRGAAPPCLWAETGGDRISSGRQPPDRRLTHPERPPQDGRVEPDAGRRSRLPARYTSHLRPSVSGRVRRRFGADAVGVEALEQELGRPGVASFEWWFP